MHTRGRESAAGFTLVELMIVVVVIAALIALAMPSYQGYQQRSKRGDAKTSLMRAQLAQEKWRGNDTDYATLAEIWTGSDSLSGYYTLAVTSNTAAAYVMTAAPKAGTTQVGDACGTFAINQDGPLYTGYADADCWSR